MTSATSPCRSHTLDVIRRVDEREALGLRQRSLELLDILHESGQGSIERSYHRTQSALVLRVAPARVVTRACGVVIERDHVRIDLVPCCWWKSRILACAFPEARCGEWPLEITT